VLTNKLIEKERIKKKKKKKKKENIKFIKKNMK